MKFGKILLVIAFISAMVAMIQQSPSLLVNQHTFVNINTDANDINCTSCHPQVADELSKSQIHSNFACEECHRIKQTAYGVTITYAERNSNSRTIGEEAHAAYTPRCLDCHGNNGIYVNYQGVTKTAPIARAFNTTPIPDYTAHKNFVEWANQSNLCVRENEACLACHTNFSVKITYKYFWNINYTKDSSWNIVNFNVNGTRSYTVLLDKTGDQGKHEWLNIGFNDSQLCIKCHKNIYDALVNGTPASPYNEYTHAPIEIDSADNGGDNYGSWGGMYKDHDWPPNNYWGNPRYHYIDSVNRPIYVNTTYCIKCHNVAQYADQNPSDATTYDLNSVIADTNSTLVHAAEKLRCTTCHGYGKTKDPYNVIATSGYWGNEIGHRNFMNQTENYANTFAGDLCMGCHEAASHNVDSGALESGRCSMCHSAEGYARCGACHSDTYDYNIDVIIESEPSGNITHTTY